MASTRLAILEAGYSFQIAWAFRPNSEEIQCRVTARSLGPGRARLDTTKTVSTIGAPDVVDILALLEERALEDTLAAIEESYPWQTLKI